MEILKKLRFLAVAQLSGIIFFIVAAFLLTQKDQAPIFGSEELVYIKLGFIILMLLGIPFVFSIPKRRIGKLASNATVQTKLELFRSNFLLKMGSLEFLALVAVVLFILTSENTYLFVTGFILVIATTLYPSTSRVCLEMGINEDDLIKK